MQVLPLPGNLAGTHRPLGTIKGFLGKELDVGAAGIVVDDSIIVGTLGLCGFEALDERFGEVEAFIVDVVQALADDLVDSVILA